MIRLSGRAMPGLDEFMLRIGHLKVISSVASEFGGARHRVERETASVLTNLTAVPADKASSVAIYLREKKLCAVSESDGTIPASDGRERYRYPELILRREGATWTVRSAISDKPVVIWWQDFCLAEAGVESKVGAITAVARPGSKTGLSHVMDWAEQCGLISTTAQASPAARLIAKLDGKTNGANWVGNPYVLQNERIILGFLLISADIDVFSRFVVRLATQASFPLKKREAARLFAATISDLVTEADAASYLSARQKFQLADLLRDLRKAARRSRGDLGDTSTSWHRTSSRLETYVDLRLLRKPSEEEKYEYVYNDTPELKTIAQTLQSGEDPQEWLNRHLIGGVCGAPTSDDLLTPTELIESLPSILGAIRSPSATLPLDIIALGVVKLRADKGSPISLGAARHSLEELAKSRPEVARLARGTSGERAEFITVISRAF